MDICEAANSTKVGVMYLLCFAVARSRSNTDRIQTACTSSHFPANPSYHLASVTNIQRRPARDRGRALKCSIVARCEWVMVSRQTLPAAPASVRVYLYGRKAGVLRRNVLGAVG